MLNTLSRQFAHIGMTVLIVGLSACATAPTPVPVAESLSRTPQLATFNRLVIQAGLKDSLNGPGPLTVFAPSDEAFKALPAKTLEALNKDPEQLKAMLNYHVVPAKLMAADIQNSSSKTVNGASLATARAGTFVTVDDAIVQESDIAASNGVVHVIDRVLTPPKK